MEDGGLLSESEFTEFENVVKTMSELRFSGLLNDPDFAFNQVNPANRGSDILQILIQTENLELFA